MELQPIQDKPPTNWKKGVVLVLLTWIFFTIAIAIPRATGEKISVPTILLFQNGISLLIMIPIVIQRGRKSLKTEKMKLILLRTVAGYCSFGFIFLATRYTSLVNVVLLSNSTPLIIPLIIWIWRGVRIGIRLWLGILVGFIGIVLILKPYGLLVDLGALFGLGSALFFSISMIAQRRLIKKESSRTILFYYFLIATLISIPLAIFTWEPITSKTIALLILLGLLSCMGQMFFLRAFRFQKPSLLAPFNYSSVVYALFIDWILWDQLPDFWSILGIIIVCAGGILAILEANTDLLKKNPKR